MQQTSEAAQPDMTAAQKQGELTYAIINHLNSLEEASRSGNTKGMSPEQKKLAMFWEGARDTPTSDAAIKVAEDPRKYNMTVTAQVNKAFQEAYGHAPKNDEEVKLALNVKTVAIANTVKQAHETFNLGGNQGKFEIKTA